MNELSIRDEMRKKFEKLQDDLYSQATLCYIGKSDGTIVVTERPGYIYVQNAQSPAIEVYNARVQPSLGLPVMVGRDPYEPWLLQVLSSTVGATDANAGSTAAVNPNSTVGPHAGTHRFNAADPVWIDKRLILPSRIGPTDITDAAGDVSGSAAIDIYPDVLTFNGLPIELTYQTVDLTSYVPASGSSRYVNVSVNSIGAIVITPGTAVWGNTPLVSDAPACPSTNLSLGWVRLYGGMSSTNENTEYTDFLDGRFSIYYASGSGGTSGSGGGLSAITATGASNLYLAVSSGSHISGSVIPGGIALDTLGMPSNITTLNATTGAHGLLPALSGNPAQFLSGSGTWLTPASGSSGGGLTAITATDSATIHFTVTSGSNISGSTVYDATVWLPDAPPTSTYALSDEFDNASLSGSWTAFDPDGTFNIDEPVTGLRNIYNQTQFGALGGVTLAHPMTDSYLTIWTKLGFSNFSEGAEAGIFLCEDVSGSPTTSDFVTFGCRVEADGNMTVNLKYWTSYNQASPTIEASGSIPYHAPIYLTISYVNEPRLADIAYSLDGVSWQILFIDYTWGFIPQQFGLFNCAEVDLGGNEGSQADYAFFRVVGDISDPIRYGNRIALKFA